MGDILKQYKGYILPDSYTIKDKTYVPICLSKHKDRDRVVITFDRHKMGKRTRITRVGTLLIPNKLEYAKFSIDNSMYVIDLSDGEMTTIEKFSERNLVIKSYQTSIYQTLNWLLCHDESFKCQILGRMQSDCEYYLGFGRGSEERLWAKNVENHILYMKELHKSLSEKPSWLTEKLISIYEKDMINIKYRN